MKKYILYALIALSLFACDQTRKGDDSEVVTDSIPTIEQLKKNKNVVVADDPKELAKVIRIVPQTDQTPVIAESFARGGKDRTKPSVWFINPKNGDTITTTLIQIGASDNVGVVSVSISINGQIVSTGYSYQFTPATDGVYTISATAKDKAGWIGTNSITVSKKIPVIVVPPPPTLPASVILANPPVWNQGGEGSCLAHTLAAQRSIEQYYKTGAKAYDSSNILSPEFLYNYCKVAPSCGSGSAILNSMNFIYNKGICTWASLPYSSQNGCDTSIITSAMKVEALNYKISNYAFSSTDETTIKTILASGHPLAFTFQMDMNFYTSTPGYIWKSRGEMMYTHACLIVGYDDTKRAYKGRNSFGTTWSDQGYFWVDYDFFKTITGYVYKMIL